MIEFEPKHVTFGCYGTLTAIGMSAVTRELVADRVPAEGFGRTSSTTSRPTGSTRCWARICPSTQVIHALARDGETVGQRAPRRHADGNAIYESGPSWAPHPDVAEPLASLAERYPLVI